MLWGGGGELSYYWWDLVCGEVVCDLMRIVGVVGGVGYKAGSVFCVVLLVFPRGSKVLQIL